MFTGGSLKDIFYILKKGSGNLILKPGLHIDNCFSLREFFSKAIFYSYLARQQNIGQEN